MPVGLASPFHAPPKQREQAEAPAGSCASAALSPASGAASARGGRKQSPGSARRRTSQHTALGGGSAFGPAPSSQGPDAPAHRPSTAGPAKKPPAGARATAASKPSSAAAKAARQQMAAMLGLEDRERLAEARLQATEEVHAEQLRLLQVQSLEREREANEMRRFETDRADALAGVLSKVEAGAAEAAKVSEIEIQRLWARLEASEHEVRTLRADWGEAMVRAEAALAERDEARAELRTCRQQQQQQQQQQQRQRAAEGGRGVPASSSSSGDDGDDGAAAHEITGEPGASIKAAAVDFEVVELEGGESAAAGAVILEASTGPASVHAQEEEEEEKEEGPQPGAGGGGE